jgi:transcription elongation factor Elf1
MRNSRSRGTSTSAKRTALDRSFKCAKCGGRLDLPDAPTNETVLSCKNCGAPLGTWVEVKHDMKAAAREIA